MGQPKLNPDIAKFSARHPAGILEDPEPIAQRFAHSADLWQAVLHPSDRPWAAQQAEPRIPALEAAASAVSRWGVQPRLLIPGFILAALVPIVILGSQWLGSAGTTEPALATTLPEPEIATPSAVLTAPDKVQTIAGEPVRFPIALDGTDGVPPRSVIAIRGLPPRSNFSEGRPYGDSEWNLKPDQIGDLDLVPPTDASGAFKLGIALIAPDDSVIAEVETLLEIAPTPTEQAAADESSIASSDGDELAALGAVPDGNEAAMPAPIPGTGFGAGDESIEEPMAMEASAPDQATADKTEQTLAAAPSDETPPDKAEPTETNESGLGSVRPSAFVNLREGPSSSETVLGVIAKGTELPVLDRRRGWVQVEDPASGKKGWIYSGNIVGEAKSHHRTMRVAPAESEPKSESFWGKLGRWLRPGKTS